MQANQVFSNTIHSYTDLFFFESTNYEMYNRKPHSIHFAINASSSQDGEVDDWSYV